MGPHLTNAPTKATKATNMTNLDRIKTLHRLRTAREILKTEIVKLELDIAKHPTNKQDLHLFDKIIEDLHFQILLLKELTM